MTICILLARDLCSVYYVLHIKNYNKYMFVIYIYDLLEE